MTVEHLGSLARIADLPEAPIPFERMDRSEWAAGDYVVGEVVARPLRAETLELADGRTCVPAVGDRVVGAFARRFATLEATGSFEAIGPEGEMHALTEGGCFGALTSRSRFSPRLMRLRYMGHVVSGGTKVVMSDFAPPAPEREFRIPVVLLAGTSMSSGKTHAGRVAVRLLRGMGHTVVAAKLTGAGRWHDTLSFADAGAESIFDFVDAGLPTTVCPPEEYREAVSGLLSRMAGTGATVAVVEAGASPLEPYNGGTLVGMLSDRIAFTFMAASDPYAVVGIRDAWGHPFDVVVGPTANTAAGIALVDELVGLPALDLFDEGSHEELAARLRGAVGAP